MELADNGTLAGLFTAASGYVKDISGFATDKLYNKEYVLPPGS